MNALGFIEKFERRLERFVNGAFSKAFKSQLQPVEISAAINAKMDAGAAVVDRDRILAPDGYKVRLSPADHSRLQQLGKALNDDVESKVKAHAKKQRYQFAGSLTITMEPDSSLTIGQLRVSASGSKAPDLASVTWRPALDINGKRYLLAKARTTVGRDAGADLPIDDAGLSRNHFAISWDGKTASIEDLGSTNGTKVSGLKIKSQTLAPDTIISAGRTEFVFRLIANGDSK